MKFENISQSLSDLQSRLGWFPPLFARVSVGLLFLLDGIGKVGGIHDVAGYFTELKIPFPLVSAWILSLNELICGGLLVIGLATRLSTIPLMIDMIVAILTAKLENLHGIITLLGFQEYLFIVILVGLMISGPGPVSLDGLVFRALQKRSRSKRMKGPPQRLAG